MTAAHCPICLTNLTIDKFVVFLCGHGFCIDCKSRMFQQSRRPKCPNCRVHIRDRDAHPLFLELVDSKAVFTSSLVEGLDKMDHGTPLLSVKKAGQKLGKALQGIPPEPNAMTALIKAVEGFKERIIPLFTKVEAQSHQISTLRKDYLESRQETEHLQDQLTKAELFKTKFIQLEIELNESKKNQNEAIRLAEIAKDELGKIHENSILWKKRTSELTAENKRYKDMLEKHIESGRSQREKQKKLQKQVTELRDQLAAKKQEILSDATQAYDGDFSAHEYSMMRSDLNVMSTPSRRGRHPQDEIHISLDMEGMPPPGFPSDWQLNKVNCGVKRGLNPRLTNTFPIALDRRGRPTKAVQLGPQSLIHIPR